MRNAVCQIIAVALAAGLAVALAAGLAVALASGFAGALAGRGAGRGRTTGVLVVCTGIAVIAGGAAGGRRRVVAVGFVFKRTVAAGFITHCF